MNVCLETMNFPCVYGLERCLGGIYTLLKVTGYSLLINIHEKILPSFSSCRIQAGMHAFIFTTKKVALLPLACNSCAGWVGGAGNLIAVPAVNSPHTKY